MSAHLTSYAHWEALQQWLEDQIDETTRNLVNHPCPTIDMYRQQVGKVLAFRAALDEGERLLRGDANDKPKAA